MLLVGIGYSQITTPYRVIYDTTTHTFLNPDEYGGYEGTITYPAYIHIVNGYQTLDLIESGIKDMALTLKHPSLPTSGLVKKGALYMYNGNIYQVRQDHEITNYSPDILPALFYRYRANAEEMEWVENEKVVVGDIRYFDGVAYVCLQAHQTLKGWEPTTAIALWKIQEAGCPEWKQPTGAHDAYNKGDCVTYKGKKYESVINANVWSPDVYPAGWKVIK